MNRLAAKVVMVAGSATGIGAECVRLFAEEGATVVAIDKNPVGESVVHDMTQRGFQAEFIRGDLTSEPDCQSTVEETVARHGRVDVLLYNAGVFSNKLVHEVTNEDFDRVFNVNVRGALWMSKYALAQMLAQGYGNICFTASKTGLVAQYNSPLYNASKGGLIQLMKSIALDYAKSGIRVNAICPGIIDTPLLDEAIALEPNPVEARIWNEQAQPLGRLGTPLECAHAALWLCSNDASFVTGVALPVDGGFTAM